MPKNAQTILDNAAAGAVTELDMQHGFDYADQDVTGWIATEKFDGCRAYWDGAELWSRSGLRIQIPAELRAELPAGMHLDGELYFGQRGLRQCSTAVRYGKFLPGMVFIVFDAPQAAGNYLQRLEAARAATDGASQIHTVKPTVCTSTAEAIALMIAVQAQGGEGVMLRHPEIPYAAGRTRQLLKLKRIY